MSCHLYYRNAINLGFTTISVLFCFQFHAVAQTVIEETNVPKTNLTQLNTPSQSQLRLLESLQPSLNANPADTVEQNIHLRLVLSERKLYVYQGDSIKATYPVAVGKTNWETPTGQFQVMNKVENPAWENPFVTYKDIREPGLENNPLGERWIGFWDDGKDEIGFHGTYQRESVGQAISHGCVRMYNEDVKQLYKMVTIGTPVNVVP
jgi:lipoprotein-anchoring transpeptidase ErfK/SrfK